MNLLLERKKIKKTFLAKKIKQGESTMHNYLNGTTLPTSDFLEVVVNLTGGNAHWILTGEGEMLIGSEPTTVNIGAMNTGIAGNVGHTYHTVGECEKDVAALRVENGLLKQAVADKEMIISLLQHK